MAATGKVVRARPAANTGSVLAWDVEVLRFPRRAMGLVREVAACLPFYVPRAGLLILDWQPVIVDGAWRVLPRMGLHGESWLSLPANAIRPTGVSIHAEDEMGERILTLQMPSRKDHRAMDRLPLATGLMRLSMQAHDKAARFLPVVMRTDLGENHRGDPALHLHRLDMQMLAERDIPGAADRRLLAANLAERVLHLMSLPGAGLARNLPMILDGHGGD